MNSIFDFHADDYALSGCSDDDILSLCRDGLLDSISILPNLSIFDSAVQKFLSQKRNFPRTIAVSVHLNVMEGKCCAQKDLLPDLVDANGFFIVSWGKLFAYSYAPIYRRKIREQLKLEIIAQIERCISAGICGRESIRIDSHQHPHMIPVFFSALTDAVSELERTGCSFSYIRISQDPISFYGGKALFSLNIIKCLILNFYSIKVRKYIKQKKLPQNYLCGVYYSGRMDGRITAALPVFEKKANACGKTVEVLFHPGMMHSNELTDEFTKKGFNDFHLSACRKIEFDTVRRLKNDYQQ